MTEIITIEDFDWYLKKKRFRGSFGFQLLKQFWLQSKLYVTTQCPLSPLYFLNNSVKNQLILIIFGIR